MVKIIMLIYMATNKINGKMYIGQTVSKLETRKKNHIFKALNKKNGMYFGKAIRKYGPEKFSWKILHNNITNIEDLNRLEIFYIGYYNTFEDGYNLNEGGNNASPSAEIRQKIANTLKGRKLSKEHIKNMTRKGEKHPMFGKHHSKESKIKMAASHVGKNKGKSNPSARAVIINNKHFDTIIEASIFLNMNVTTVSINLKNKIPGYEYVCKEVN